MNSFVFAIAPLFLSDECFAAQAGTRLSPPHPSTEDCPEKERRLRFNDKRKDYNITDIYDKHRPEF